MEKTYWKDIGMMPQGSSYVSAGMGMGEVLQMAALMEAYALTDRATYATYKEKRVCALLLKATNACSIPTALLQSIRRISPILITKVQWSSSTGLHRQKDKRELPRFVWAAKKFSFFQENPRLDQVLIGGARVRFARNVLKAIMHQASEEN